MQFIRHKFNGNLILASGWLEYNVICTKKSTVLLKCYFLLALITMLEICIIRNYVDMTSMMRRKSKIIYLQKIYLFDLLIIVLHCIERVLSAVIAWRYQRYIDSYRTCKQLSLFSTQSWAIVNIARKQTKCIACKL